MDFRAGEGAGGEILQGEPQGGAQISPVRGSRAAGPPRTSRAVLGGKEERRGLRGGPEPRSGGRGRATPDGFIGRRRRRRAVPGRSHAGPGAALRHRPLAAAAAAAP